VGTYKLIQDIEAEDHILGPLTLRQFIFALIAAFCFYLCFIVTTKGAAFLLILFLPPGLFFGFFALPFGRDQPTEVWALAKIRFWFKPRNRIWDQSGVKELVTITVPKKIEHVYTDGLSQLEVKSRLSALADTIDTRGWAVKNVNVGSYMSNTMVAPDNSDRLLDINAMPVAVPEETTLAREDILDERNNPVAQQFDSMMNQSSQQHHQLLMAQMSQAAPPAAPAASNQWFMQGSALAATAPALVNYTPPPPLDASQPSGPTDAASAMTTPTDPAILSLANNNDLNVATLAREAQKASDKRDESDQDEVVISLR
jgi:hypothetical protein